MLEKRLPLSEGKKLYKVIGTVIELNYHSPVVKVACEYSRGITLARNFRKLSTKSKRVSKLIR